MPPLVFVGGLCLLSIEIGCGGLMTSDAADAGRGECPNVGSGVGQPPGGSCSASDSRVCTMPWDRPACGGGTKRVVSRCTCDGTSWSCENEDSLGRPVLDEDCDAGDSDSD